MRRRGFFALSSFAFVSRKDFLSHNNCGKYVWSLIVGTCSLALLILKNILLMTDSDVLKKIRSELALLENFVSVISKSVSIILKLS